MNDLIKKEIDAHIKTAISMHDLTENIAKCADLCIKCIQNGGKILLFGNGGSAADAQHIAAELVGRYKTSRNGISAIALTTDTSALTSIGNDFGYEHVFDRQVESLANEGDVLIGISTSGKSTNVINALNVASKIKCSSIGLSGCGGGDMNQICDINVVVSSEDTPRIQEMHIIIGHVICHLIEQELIA